MSYEYDENHARKHAAAAVFSLACGDGNAATGVLAAVIAHQIVHEPDSDDVQRMMRDAMALGLKMVAEHQARKRDMEDLFSSLDGINTPGGSA